MLTLMGVTMPLILGLLFSTVTKRFWVTTKWFFFMLGAPCFAGAFIALSFKVSYYYGVALYYGTAVIATMLRSFIPRIEDDFFISFIIMALICYCYFLKQKINKSRLDDSDE